MSTHAGKTKRRPCLKCDRPFHGTSEIRVCADCKANPDYRTTVYCSPEFKTFSKAVTTRGDRHK